MQWRPLHWQGINTKLCLTAALPFISVLWRCHQSDRKTVFLMLWPFPTATHQGIATLTACSESYWATAPGRWRRRRSESSASERGGRSWRNAPAPRRCYLPGVSRWPRWSRRLWTRCGTSTLCCECSLLTFSSIHVCNRKDSQFHANAHFCSRQ